MKNLVLLLIVFILPFNLMAQAPKAYFSTTKGTMVVDGKEAGLSWLSLAYKIPGEFADNKEANELYKEYLSSAKLGAFLFWGGLLGLVVSAFAEEDGVLLASSISYLGGFIVINKASLKLNKAVNIYNGVPSEQAFKPSNRDLEKIASSYGIGFKFEF